MTTKKPNNPAERLMAMCAHREMCEQQALEKLRLWQVEPKEQAEILAQLVKERFIDNNRYARAYAREKLKFNKWGTKKVEMMLQMKGIDSDIIEEAIDECADKEELQETLRQLLEAKRYSLRKETDEFKKKQKLIRFALSRGYSYDEVMKFL